MSSDKDNIEFTVTYDTNTRTYNDTYEYGLNLRKCVGQLYEKTQNTFSDFSEKVTFSANVHNESVSPSKITSIQDLNNLLIDVTEGDPNANSGTTYTRLYMYVNTNSFDFCEKEYNNIKMINDYLNELQLSSELYSKIGFSIYTLDSVKLLRLESVIV